MTRPDKQFEDVARAIFFRLREQFSFTHVEGSHHYPARDSGVKRQIDITAYWNDGGMVLIECKLHKEPIDIGYVDAFHTIIHTDVGAEGGIFVSSEGFTRGAVKSANAKQIGLATLNADATEYDFTLQIAELILRGVSRDIGSLLKLVDGTQQWRTDETDSVWLSTELKGLASGFGMGTGVSLCGFAKIVRAVSESMNTLPQVL